MDKRNHFYLVLLQENPFFYCLDQIWGHSLVSQTPTGDTTDVRIEYMNVIHLNPTLFNQISTGDSTDVGREYMHVIHLCPMFYWCIMDKMNHFYLVLLWENPFFYCLEQIWVHLLVSQTPTGGSTDVGTECMNVRHFCPMFYVYISDTKNHFYFILLWVNSFYYCLEQINLCSFTSCAIWMKDVRVSIRLFYVRTKGWTHVMFYKLVVCSRPRKCYANTLMSIDSLLTPTTLLSIKQTHSSLAPSFSSSCLRQVITPNNNLSLKSSNLDTSSSTSRQYRNQDW
jgi:hypothetical protein